MKYSLLRVVSFCLIVFLSKCCLLAEAATQELEPVKEPDTLYAISACLMDAESERVLYAKNGDEKRANASTTKIMTLIVTLERAGLDELVTVSEYAAKQPDVQLNINSGEKYILRDLCYSLMLESHNDSAVAIAEHVGGSVEGFAAMMNAKAEEIGCENTHFVTPNGLDAKDENGEHGTTAKDLAKILSYCILKSEKHEEFLEITRTPSYTFGNKNVDDNGAVTNGNRTFSCNNHNAFLTMMDGALSGKTGFTGNAGYCYTGALKRDGRTFVVALLGCGWPNNKSYKWSDTKKLMQYGIDNYKSVNLEDYRPEEQIPEEIAVWDADTEDFSKYCMVPLQVTEGETDWKTDTVLLRKDESVETECRCEKNLRAPVAEDTVVGEIVYRINGNVVRRDKIVCGNHVKKYDFEWGIRQIVKRFFL